MSTHPEHDQAAADALAMIQAQANIARWSREFYTSLVAEGFTEDQALTLTRAQVRALFTTARDGG